MNIFQTYAKSITCRKIKGLLPFFLLIIFFSSNATFASDLISYKSNYQQDEPVWIELKNSPNNPQDWIGIYAAGDNTDWGNVISWRWASQSSQTTVDPGNWYKFPDNTITGGEAPLPEGRYIARFFLNNTYTVDTSVSFTVKMPHVTSQLETYKKTYDTDENIWIELKNAPGNTQDWVGIYPADANNDWNNVKAWRWANENSQTSVDPGIWYKFSDTSIKPNEQHLPLGNYEARFFLNNTYNTEHSVYFKIKSSDNNADKIYPPESELTSKKVDRVPRPILIGKDSSYLDKAFDNSVTRTVTRLTNRERDLKGANGHQYPKQGSAWNSDMTLLRIDRRIYDADTLKEIALTKGKNADIVMLQPKSASSGIRWSKHNPNILYVMSGDNKFYELTINANRETVKQTVIYDLNETGKTDFSIGHDEGNIDYADQYVVLSATSGSNIYVVLLDIKEKNLVWEPKKLSYASNQFDWISISPSGNYILVAVSRNGVNQIDLHNASNFELIKKKLTTSAQHGDIGKNANNEDIYVQWEQNGYSGYLLKNQKQITLLDFKVGSAHVSCRNYKLKGWCYVSSTEKGYREVFALKLDGSQKVRRFVKTHARGPKPEDPQLGDDNNYYYAALPTGVPSPDGTRALFWSDYGNPEAYLYYTKKEDGSWEVKDHYYYRDTYQVTISK